MTDSQKEQHPEHKTQGGFLLERTYKEAWKLWWDNASEKDKSKFLSLPNFDKDIFFEITGVEV